MIPRTSFQNSKKFGRFQKKPRSKSNSNSVIDWALKSKNTLSYWIGSETLLSNPFGVLPPRRYAGSTAVVNFTSTNVIAGVQALSVAQINNFTTRFSGFREYLIVKVECEIKAVQGDSSSFTGYGAFWVDDDSNVTPTSTALDNIKHMSLPILQESGRVGHFKWSPRDVGEAEWEPLASTTNELAYLKWYGDQTNTGLSGANGSQAFLVDFMFTVAFRGDA